MNDQSIVPAGKQADIVHTAAIDPEKPVRISVTNHDGEVQVRPTNDGQVTVNGYLLRSHGSGTEDEDPFIFEADANTITVRPHWQVGNTMSDIAQRVKTQLKEGFRAEDWDFKKMRFAGDVSYDIEVLLPQSLPEGSSIAVKTTSGDVRIQGIDANVSIASASGDVRVEQVTGKLSAHSASGDVTLRGVNGSMESNTASGDISVEGGDAWTALRSVSGDITVRNVMMKNARITTVSGTVEVDASLNNAWDYTFDSVSGDMKLTTLVPSRGATLSYRSISGDARLEGGWEKGPGKRSWTIGEAGSDTKISVKTVSGDLRANGVVSGDLQARSETMPTDVREETVEDGQTGAAESEEKDSGHSVATDADWERAKGWLKDITQRVSKFVEDMDEAGDRRYRERQQNASRTEPIDVRIEPRQEPSTETSASTEPVSPPDATAPTEPLTPKSPAAPTEPLSPPEPPAPAEPEEETTAQRRLRLLEAVQRGEMTVDEALAQLDDAKGDS